MREIKVFSSLTANDFVGLKITDAIEIYLPHGLEIDESKKFEDVKKMLQIIKKTKNYYQDNVEIIDSMKIKEDFPLFDYLWIILDYISNGIYKRTNKILDKTQKGKIVWKKTIQMNSFFTEDGLFLKDIYKSINKSSINLISNIHIFCINIAYDICSWYFGELYIPDNNLNQINISYFIHLIKSIYSQTFNDREKRLLKTMLVILSDYGGKESNHSIMEYGTYNYAFIWESMVHKVFNNVDIERYYPKAFYEINGIDHFIVKSRLRPDSMIVKDDFSCVIDSKYYRFGCTRDINHLPPISDIQKQISYGKYINNLFLKKGISIKLNNSFIIPFKSTENSMINIGIAGIELNDSTRYSSYEKINIILADTNYIIESYFNNNEKNILDFIKLF